jgi:hypothetical protein
VNTASRRRERVCAPSQHQHQQRQGGDAKPTSASMHRRIPRKGAMFSSQKPVWSRTKWSNKSPLQTLSDLEFCTFLYFYPDRANHGTGRNCFLGCSMPPWREDCAVDKRLHARRRVQAGQAGCGEMALGRLVLGSSSRRPRRRRGQRARARPGRGAAEGEVETGLAREEALGRPSGIPVDHEGEAAEPHRDSVLLGGALFFAHRRGRRNGRRSVVVVVPRSALPVSCFLLQRAAEGISRIQRTVPHWIGAGLLFATGQCDCAPSPHRAPLQPWIMPPPKQCPRPGAASVALDAAR